MKIERKSNIEILRIICMILILSGHLIGQGQLLNTHFGHNWLIYRFLTNGARVSVNCFVIIGAWFLVDMDFDFKRVLRIWLEVAFYNIILTGLMILLGQPVGIKRIVQIFIPIFGEPLWFASVYIGLLIISPFLNKILNCCSQTIIKKFLIITTLAFSVSATLIPTADVLYSNIGWFIYLYILIGYYKRYIITENTRKMCVGGEDTYYLQV